MNGWEWVREWSGSDTAKPNSRRRRNPHTWWIEFSSKRSSRKNRHTIKRKKKAKANRTEPKKQSNNNKNNTPSTSKQANEHAKLHKNNFWCCLFSAMSIILLNIEKPTHTQHTSRGEKNNWKAPKRVYTHAIEFGGRVKKTKFGVRVCIHDTLRECECEKSVVCGVVGVVVVVSLSFVWISVPFVTFRNCYANLYKFYTINAEKINRRINAAANNRCFFFCCSHLMKQNREET